MKPSESRFLDIRGLRYHVRHWPAPGAAKMVLLHGWMDVSASFQFMVDALRGRWDVYAPDWRGYGLTEWGKSDCYWFPDYIADLDRLAGELSPDEPLNLVGHSLGGNVSTLYAGARPGRVARLVNLEGFGMAPTRPEQAPGRYARWLEELRDPPGFRRYADFAELAERLRRNNPRLAKDQAEFLARHWGKEVAGDGVALRADPAHKIVNPVLYRYEEVRACWSAVTAPVLWVEAEHSETARRLKLESHDLAERRRAFRNLRHATVPGAGHMLHHDQPAAVAKLVEEFLAR